MSLLEDIQNAAIDANSDLGTLLRKCKVLAAHLGSKPLEDWLLWESNGYPEGVQVPDYRVWTLEVTGHFMGPFGSGLKNAPIPHISLPKEARKSYAKYQCIQSIASIEAALKVNDTGTIEVSTGDLAVMLGSKVYKGQNCVQAWASFSTSSLVELLNSVRNRLLDFVLAVWKEDPTAGESSDSIAGVHDSTKITQIFNTTVYGGAANLVGTANNSSVTFNIDAGNFKSLKEVLSKNGLSDDDINKLKVALESDEHPKLEEGFGPKVSSWIATMMEKAANNSWGIGVGAAGNLLAQAISKYYGL